MATIAEQKIINGVLEDEKLLMREIPQGVSKIDANKMLLAHMCVYMFLNPDGVIDSETLAKVTTVFQEQFGKIKDIVTLFTLIEECGANDSVTGEPDVVAREAAMTTLATDYGLTAETFVSSRNYK